MQAAANASLVLRLKSHGEVIVITILEFIQQNTTWLFGSTSLAAIIVAYISRPKASRTDDRSNDIVSKARHRRATAVASGSEHRGDVFHNTIFMVAVSVALFGMAIVSIAFVRQLDIAINTINSGSESDNVIGTEGSKIEIH